jgi:hypothetical protein
MDHLRVEWKLAGDGEKGFFPLGTMLSEPTTHKVAFRGLSGK